MLSYDQPINRAKPEPRRAAIPAGFNVLELIRLLWERKVAILSAALLCTCIAVAIGKSLTPKYTAGAQLYVDPRELQLVERELTPRAQDVSGLSMVVESQSRLITSNNVLLQVIRDTNLVRDPEFGGGAASRGLLASLLGLFGIEPRTTAEQQQQIEMNTLDTLNRHINVKKTDRTFIVDIDVWSHDPVKAAMLANAIAKAYLTESKQSQAEAARRATRDLSGRLKELQQRLRNAEEALATYKAQNNFVGSQDNLLTDQQLSVGNQRLAAARALTLDAQAKYDQIEASRRGSMDPGAIPEALQSPTIANLRSQYADAKKRQAELQGELGPRHPALRQVDQQVEDLRRTIKEEIDRFAVSAKNDLTRARDYEASLNKALDVQKHQSVQMSQASVRLRELEREVDASRDVYQSFLKRSRETEEQESLNTSSARVIGDATIPQQRTFPPAMSLLAMIGFMFGALAAAAWIVAASQLAPGAGPIRPKVEPKQDAAAPERQAVIAKPKPPVQAAPAIQPAAIVIDNPVIEKPLIAELRESDVMRTLGGILSGDNPADVTRFGWPTLRTGSALGPFSNTVRQIHAALATGAAPKAVPVLAVIGTADDADRSMVALNIALVAVRDGARALLIDADAADHALTDRVAHPVQSKPSRLDWLTIGSKASRAINTANGIAILPAIKGNPARASEAIQKAIAQARLAGSHDLVILDGPPLPWGSDERRLFDMADGLIAALPADRDINASMEDIITALGGAERKLAGVVINELQSASQQHDKQYA
ncbi:exopolysaccharide transport family protein [Bradyrhizobium mercantei]|uniref:exopolysaccharide transport family protein n=1 Tax=Bradyrhizobium mercantei TaxID=1904807 RepID=UPI000976F224|nr:exopolysaccharide transport family protein [Bradyrhizobium mercantei]